MKALKIIAFLSFVLIFYPAIALPLQYKEWMVAVMSFFIFIFALIMIYILKSKEAEPSFEEYTAAHDEDLNKSKDDEKSSD